MEGREIDLVAFNMTAKLREDSSLLPSIIRAGWKVTGIFLVGREASCFAARSRLLAECPVETLSANTELPPSIPSALKWLAFKGASQASLRELGKHYRSLEHLTVDYCEHFSWGAELRLQQFPRLRHFQALLGGSVINSTLASIKDRSFFRVCSRCI